MGKIKITKPKILLSSSLALFSFEVYLGAISGYFLAKFLSGKRAGYQGIIKSIALRIGNYRLHLHHWLVGLGILISAFLFNFHPFLSQFSFGFLGGLIFQGVFCYPDWHKILIRHYVK